ncbi:hypothetical protein L0152_27405, partial [bacterium]|nr:hypothetical protein [bacterium]
MQAAVDGNTTLFENRTSTNFATQHGYSNNAFPATNLEIWTVTYYDDYDFDYNGTADSTYKTDSEFVQASFGGNAPFYRLKGKVTGTKTRVFLNSGSSSQLSGTQTIQTDSAFIKDVDVTAGSNITIEAKNGIRLSGEFKSNGATMVFKPGVTSASGPILAIGSGGITIEWLTSVVYFDKYGRVIQTQSNNSLGGSDISFSEYDFAGKAIKTKTVHQTPVTTVTVVRNFEYDHAGRLIKTYQKNNSDAQVMLAQNKYNELGTLIEKDLHSTNGGSNFLQAVNYSYNIRGWMTSINDNDPSTPELDVNSSDLFAMKLNYNQRTQSLGGKDEYNGNISEQIWKIKDGQQYAYGYVYDELNQLTWAKFQNGAYDEMMTYDLNGNIKTLQRYAGTGTMVDNLNMTLSGNKLMGSDDGIATTAMASDFEDQGSTYSGSNMEYVYDVNGNMIVDKNKGITNIEYNYLNLPTKVEFGSTKKIEWVYTATGVKIEKKVTDNGSVVSSIDYVS